MLPRLGHSATLVADGEAAVETLRGLDPGVKAIVNSDDPVMVRHREHGFLAVRAKPCRLDRLVAVLVNLYRNET